MVLPFCCLVWFCDLRLAALTPKENYIEIIISKMLLRGNKHKQCCVTDDLSDFSLSSVCFVHDYFVSFHFSHVSVLKRTPILTECTFKMCPYSGCKSICFSFSCFTCCCIFSSVYYRQLLKFTSWVVCLNQTRIQSNAQRTWSSKIYVGVSKFKA